MCKFCEDGFKIDSTIDDKKLCLYLDSNNKKILNIKISSSETGGTIKPISIMYCPFCSKDLEELNCEECYNYNIGDGVDDPSICDKCICR